MTTVNLQDIAIALPIFVQAEQKRKVYVCLGALMTRLISLRKGAEIMEIDSDELLQILNLLGIEFSYLSGEDVKQEQAWSRF